ncbi:flippase [Priestia megaterium]|uniref:flippase n=1 Tax=Priestia megaterium TaxID=1404 RepID=UPI00390C4DAD
MKKQIGMNTIVEILAKVVTFIISIIIGRIFGPAVFGTVSSAQAITSYLNLIGDLGTNNEAIRTISENPEEKSKVFTHVLVYRVAISIITIVVSVILILLNILNDQILLLFIIFNLCSLFIPNAIFIGLTLFKYNGYVNLINALTSFTLFILFLFLKQNIIYYPIALAIGSLIAITSGYLIYFKKIGTLKFGGWKSFIKFIKSSIALGITNIFARIYYDFDIVMLSLMTGSISVGLYSAAFKIIQMLWFLPNMYVLYALPNITRIIHKQSSQLNEYVQSILRYVMLFIFPLLPFTILYGKDFLTLIYGNDYKNAYNVLVVLVAGFVCMCIKTVFGNILVANRQENILLKLSISASIFNVLLNLVLISYIGLIGAAISTLLTEMLLMAFEYILVKKQFEFVFPLTSICKILGVLLVLYLVFENINFNIWINISLSIFTYVCSLILIKEKSIMDLLKMIKKHAD